MSRYRRGYNNRYNGRACGAFSEMKQCETEETADELGKKMAMDKNSNLSSGKLRAIYITIKEINDEKDEKKQKTQLIRLKKMIAYKKDYYGKNAKNLIELIEETEKKGKPTINNLFNFIEAWLCYAKLEGKR